LTDLTKKGQPTKVVWKDSHDRAFGKLKAIISASPILRLPDLEKPFVVRTDASECGLGAILLQEEGGVLWPVAYASKKLLPREVNYSTIEKECFAIIWGILKFQRYLFGGEFILEMDHQSLQFLLQKRAPNSRLMRWSLLLQPYRFTVRYIKGADNVGADYLSRLF
jgi:hypothetical protein